MKKIFIGEILGKEHLKKGDSYKSKLDYKNAILHFNLSIELAPHLSEAYYKLGEVYFVISNYKKSIENYTKAININPKNTNAYYNRGVAQLAIGNAKKALYDFFLISKKLASGDKVNYCIATSYIHLEKYSKAVEFYDKFIEIYPSDAEAHYGRGVAMQMLNNYTEAIFSYKKCIELQPKNLQAHINLGNILKLKNHVEDAIFYMESALLISPNSIDANFNLSLLLLLSGDYKNGWLKYEWRLLLSNFQNHCSIGERWNGDSSLKNKSILLTAEQGLGDTIQFSRYASLVKSLGAQVYLHVPDPLVEIMKTINGVDDVIPISKKPDFCDFHCPLMSLPMIFGTDLNSIPMSEGYINIKSHEKNSIQNTIITKKLKVGIAWSGSKHPSVVNNWSNINERRNIPVQLIYEAFNGMEVTFYSLQKDGNLELKQLINKSINKAWCKESIVFLSDEVKNFYDMGILIESLDLVISVDTSIAHLSGAMGKKTWLLNRFDSCWRWLLKRTDSPWYKSVYIYRQDDDLDWLKILMTVKKDLQRLC